MNKCLPVFIARFTKAVQKEYKSARDAYSANEKSSKKRSKRKGEHRTILLVVTQEKPNQLDFVCTLYTTTTKTGGRNEYENVKKKVRYLCPPARAHRTPLLISAHHFQYLQVIRNPKYNADATGG